MCYNPVQGPKHPLTSHLLNESLRYGGETTTLSGQDTTVSQASRFRDDEKRDIRADVLDMHTLVFSMADKAYRNSRSPMIVKRGWAYHNKPIDFISRSDGKTGYHKFHNGVSDHVLRILKEKRPRGDQCHRKTLSSHPILEYFGNAWPCETILARDLGIHRSAILCRWPNHCGIDSDVSLEKVLLAYQAEIERHYEIFHELLADANTEDKKRRFRQSQKPRDFIT